MVGVKLEVRDTVYSGSTTATTPTLILTTDPVDEPESIAFVEISSTVAVPGNGPKSV